MRGIQGAFGRLCIPLGVMDKDARGDLIEICVRLHNLCVIKVGINQIRTVYMKHWQETEDDIQVWKDSKVCCSQSKGKRTELHGFMLYSITSKMVQQHVVVVVVQVKN